MTNKPTYKISASLLNKYLYYLKNPTQRVLDELIDTLNGVFVGNEYTKRGEDFENEVFEGKHGKLSQLVQNLPRNTWANKVIDFGDFNVLISGKMDAIDKDKRIIYDIKRIGENSINNYNDANTVQHTLYYYINDDFDKFYYLLAVSNSMDNDPEKIRVEVKYMERPDQEELENKVISVINDFFNFLKEKGLWKLYTEKQQAKTKRRV